MKMFKSDNKCSIWLKLEVVLVGPMIFGCIYVPPEDSNIHQYYDEPLFSKINDEIEKLKQFGPVLIVADWNARLGELKD